MNTSTHNTFCFSPWSGIDISSAGVIKPCCKFKETQFNINNHSIAEFRNSALISDIKTQFINGLRPPECDRCWKEEANNIQSKRQLDYHRWYKEYAKYNLYESKLLVLSIATSNICNLKCRICNAKNSTKWIKEELTYTNTEIKYTPYLKDANVINEINSLMDDIIHIDFHGGEPLLPSNNDHIKLLQHLVNNRRSNEISLHYISNGTMFPTDMLINLWKNFTSVDMQLSLDGIGSHFEYNRFPANWKSTYNNIKKFQSLASTTPNIVLNIAHTLSIFTIIYLPEFIDWCSAEELPTPWIGRLNAPLYYQPGIIPQNSKLLVYDKLASHSSPIVSTWKNEVFNNDASEFLPKFKEWTTRIDLYRGQSFIKTFPELANLL